MWPVTADARVGGTRADSLRESAWEASSLSKKDALLTIIGNFSDQIPDFSALVLRFCDGPSNAANQE